MVWLPQVRACEFHGYLLVPRAFLQDVLLKKIKIRK